MVLTPRRYQVHSCMSTLEFTIYVGTNVKEETFEISSLSTLREDHEASHKSRHMMNMTPNGLGTEA
jgi:hypothetical protein